MLKNSRHYFSALLLALSLVASTASYGDDTEIYFDTNSNQTTAPLVMFYIEYTPNLASQVCPDPNATVQPVITADNLDTECSQIAPLRTYMAANDLDDGKIDQFEITRTALKRVLAGLGGLKIGLLMAHDNGNCSGGPLSDDDAKRCSQGGYILQGFTPVEKPSTTFNAKTATPAQLAAELSLASQATKKALFAKLDLLPSPQGGFSHENQNKEIYFELFRYLTGQGVYNGFNGGADFNTDRPGAKVFYNLGDLTQPPGGAFSTYNCATGFTCDTTTIANGTARFVVTDSKTKGLWDGDFAPIGKQYMSTTPFKWDTSVIDGTEYRSPLDVNCAKIFVINVVDGGGNSADDANTAINMSVTAGGMVDTPNFTYGNGDTGFVQMVDWLNDTDLADGSINGLDVSGDQTVTSFFVAKHTSQVDAAAAAGGTGYGIQLGVNAEEVVDALNKIFNQVVSVSTTFVAASIPVNAFNRSSVLDNAYLALFQANENVQPNWVGNLKKLKLRIKPVCNQFDPATNTCIDSENILMLVDNLDPNNSAIANDGRIIQDAFTFWTQANGYDLFDNIDPDIETAGRDGRSVNRGGAGQQIPNFINADGTQGAMNWLNSSNGRRLYTEAKPYITTSNGLLDVQWDQIYYLWPSILGPDDSYRLTQWPTNFTYTGSWSPDAYLDTGIACHTFYGSANSYLYSSCWIGDIASNVLAYMRGYNTQATVDTERDKSRRWLMNDPLHSRPRPINYGARGLGYSQTNPDIRILMGSNDGYLRMIRNTNPDGSDDGSEVWAFMPRAVMKYQKQLMDNGVWNNNPVIPRHPIGTDGPPVEYINDVDGDGTIDPADGDQVWIFFGLRRGGRGYYALDISDPDNPKTLWASGKIDNTLPDFTELGLTFSQPTIRKLKWGNNTVEKPVLIFGGGYDTNKDAPGIGTNDSMGRAVYVVDAASGTLVWKADYTSTNGLMTDSIPSEVTPFDATGDGIVDRFYVGDTGGQLWRADLTGTDVSQWKITRILNVGRHYSATSVADDRRFFFPPEVVSTMDGSGAYVGVVIGSGNREHPLDLTITDWMYLYKDRQATALTADFSMLTHDQLQDVTDNCVQQVALDCATDFSLTNGWRLRLEDQGEKSLSPPLVVRGVVYFNTYVPAGSASATSCGPDEGTGWYYEVALRDGRAVTNYDSTNTAVDAEGNTVELQKEDRRVTLASGGIPAENVYVSFSDGTNSFTGILRPDLKAGQDLGRGRWRTYWYEQQK